MWCQSCIPADPNLLGHRDFDGGPRAAASAARIGQLGFNTALLTRYLCILHALFFCGFFLVLLIKIVQLLGRFQNRVLTFKVVAQADLPDTQRIEFRASCRKFIDIKLTVAVPEVLQKLHNSGCTRILFREHLVVYPDLQRHISALFVCEWKAVSDREVVVVDDPRPRSTLYRQHRQEWLGFCTRIDTGWLGSDG